MNTKEMEEDAVDLQELQAQIDLSMSFAQNMVTSWVKPTHYPQSTRQRNLEDEIKEYVRRPARLGVGAPIPETQSLAHEATRLKHRLEGKMKRRRDDEDLGVKRTPSNEQEEREESRANAITQKPRVDVFGTSLKERKKRVEPSGIHPAAMKAMSRYHPGAGDAGDKLEANERTPNLIDGLEPTEAHKKKKRKKKKKNPESNSNGIHLHKAKPPQGALLANVDTTVNGAPLSQGPASLETSIEHTNPPPTSVTTMPLQLFATSTVPRQGLPVASLSLTAGPLQSPRHFTTSVDFPGQPLFNLDGPCAEECEGCEEGEDAGTLGSTPKKKRKRRKKKKSQQNLTQE